MGKSQADAPSTSAHAFPDAAAPLPRWGQESPHSLSAYFHREWGHEIGEATPLASPDASAGIPKDHFSIRWTGNFVAPETGKFTFSLKGDGRNSLKIGGVDVLADEAVPLEKGKAYPVAVEYVHEEGGALLRVGWSVGGKTDEVMRVGAN